MNQRKKVGEIGFGQPFNPKGPYLRKATNSKSGKPLPLGPSLDQKESGEALRSLPQAKFDSESIMQRPVQQKKLTNPGSTSTTAGATSTPTSTSETTSSQTTTSTTIGTTSMPYNDRERGGTSRGRGGTRGRGGSRGRGRGGQAYVPRDTTDSTNVTSSSSQYNAVTSERGIFYPLSESSKIDFAVPIKNPFHFIPDIPDFGPSYDPATTNFSGEFRSSLHVNLSNFSIRFLNLSNSGDTVSALCKTVTTIYDRISDDVFRDSRSNTVSIWSYSNFTTYLYNVCRALEWISTLDSILGYEARDGVINQGLMGLKDRFNTSKILTLRSDLRQNLLGKVFPPKFAEIIRWFYQNYQTSEIKYSPCYRYVPDDIFITKIASVDELETTINTVITNLSGSTNSQIGGALSKLYPSWVIKDIPGGYHDSLYDVHHSEMFMNEPIVFVDRKASTTTNCIYPNPASTTADIPYYTREMPSDTNGFAHILSCFNKCNANSYGWTGTDNVKFNSGIRFISYVEPTSAVNKFKTNKFFFDPVNIAMQPRLYNTWSSLADYSAHKAISENTTVAATAFSIAPRGYGRVYYNNIDSTYLNIRLFVNHLFGMKL